MSSRTSTPWILLVLGIAIFWCFAPSLNFPFYGDDFGAVKYLFDLQQSNQLLAQVWSDFGSTWLNGGGNFYRPLVVVSYALDLTIWGSHSWGWHLTNIGLHTLNTIMVFLIGREVLQKAQARGATWIALAGAMVFGLRPVIGEVVFWISGRGDSMALAGMLVAFYAYLRANGEWNRWMGVGLVSFAFALASKEPAATFPALIGAWHIATYLAAPQRPPFRRWLTDLMKGIAPFALLVVGYLLLRRVIFGSFFQVYPPELVAPIELDNWIWWLGKISTLQYFIGPQLSNSLWVKAQNYLVVLLIVGGFLLAFRYPITRLLWGLGAIWFTALVVASIQQLYVTPFGEGERLLYILLLPFAFMVISPLGSMGATSEPAPPFIAKGVAVVGSGIVLVVLMITIPWTLGRLAKWGTVGTQINGALALISQQAEEVPPERTRLLILPSTLDGIHFARNAQGPMMSPPFQARNWFGPVWVYTSERPCQLVNPPTAVAIADYRCWNVQEQQFAPFDPTTYNPDDYPFFWILEATSVLP